MLINIIRGLFAVAGVVLAALMARDISKTHKRGELTEKVSPIKSSIIGFVANFCDAIGVGSYAVAVSLNRIFDQIPLRILPGTLAVGVGLLPTMIEIIIGMSIIEVDGITVLTVAILSLIGGWLGAKLISHFSEKKVLITVGPILVIVGIVIAIKTYGAYTAVEGADVLAGTTGVTGIKLIIAAIGAFVVGMLQAWGLGYFAPTMALLIMLGMDARSIYPVMYAGAGAGMVGAANKFIQEGTYAKKASIYMSIAGVIGVILALTLVKNVDLKLLNALVACILLYIGSEMFMKGLKFKPVA